MISKNKIYFFEVEKEDQKLVSEKYPEAQFFSEPFSRELAEKCTDAEIVCGMVHSEFSAENLGILPNLKLIVTRSVGYDHIDLKFASERNIPVCNVPDYGSHVIAEHVFALLLSSCRNVLEGEERTNHDNFSACGLRGIALKDKTLGVIGTGRIGAHVCRVAACGFGMKVIAYDPKPNQELAKECSFKYVKSLEEIWKQADMISLHTPLLPETKHMINTETIAKMKDGVILINTARGGLIDTSALLKAIRNKKFSHVALDVIEHETNIKEDKELLHIPGVIITPHIAFYADQSMKNMYTESFKSIDEFLAGKDLGFQVQGH